VTLQRGLLRRSSCMVIQVFNGKENCFARTRTIASSRRAIAVWQTPIPAPDRIRVEMERRLFAASKNGACVLIVRAGDFFGPQAGNNWFSQGLVKPGKPVTAVSNPGNRRVGHQWSYLPDVARTMIELLARRDSLGPFTTFHMAGHWDADGSQMAEAI
jgi:nucleoside-diphosphate-sugar epimerase